MERVIGKGDKVSQEFGRQNLVTMSKTQLIVVKALCSLQLAQ